MHESLLGQGDLALYKVTFTWRQFVKQENQGTDALLNCGKGAQLGIAKKFSGGKKLMEPTL